MNRWALVACLVLGCGGGGGDDGPPIPDADGSPSEPDAGSIDDNGDGLTETFDDFCTPFCEAKCERWNECGLSPNHDEPCFEYCQISDCCTWFDVEDTGGCLAMAFVAGVNSVTACAAAERDIPCDGDAEPDYPAVCEPLFAMAPEDP